MKKLLTAAAAASLAFVASAADAAVFAFNASFTYGGVNGDTYNAAGTLTADLDDGVYLVTGADGQVTTDWGLMRTIDTVFPNFFSGQPSQFTLAGDGSVATAELFLAGDGGFYAVSVNGTTRTGFFGEVGGPLNSLSIVEQVDSAVPEPATWAMMIAGFAMVGAGLRRRRAGVAHA